MAEKQILNESETAGQVTPGAAREALNWLLRMQSGDFPARQRLAWQRWRAASPTHESAWQRIEQVNRRLGVLDSAPVAMHALDASGRVRRRNLKLLGGMAGLGLVALGGREIFNWRFGGAYISGIGELQAATLPDGSRLLLNTDSAVDLLADEQGYILVLRRGEIMITTAAGLVAPFRLRTAYGALRTPAASFLVRDESTARRAGVLTGSVEISPADDLQASYLVQAGQQTRFSRAAAAGLEALPPHASAWTDGMLIAVDMPLSRFLAELGRYRHGILRCAPEIADWRISGSYPVADTERALAALVRALPVVVKKRTDYWVTVEAR